MEQKSAFRAIVALGLVLTALLSLLVTAPAAEDAGKTSLLVKCDARAVPQVLRALAGLDVEVHDLETMKPLAVSPTLPIDAYAVMESLRKVAAGLRLERMHVKPRYASIVVSAERPEGLDALEQVLGERQDAVAAGAMKRTPDGWRQDFRIRLARPVGHVPKILEESVDRAWLDEQLTAERTRLVYASAERRQAVHHSGMALYTRTYQLDETTLDALSRVLARLAARPGITVSEVSWTRREKTEMPGAIKKSEFALSWYRAK